MSEWVGVATDTERLEVPGGWIYRIWYPVPGGPLGGEPAMQAVFVPSVEMTAAASDQAISAAATKPAAGPASVESSEQPVVAAVISAGEWPKDYTRQLCEIWVARWGKGSAPGDVIGSSARVLKKEGASWQAVIRSFQRYVDTVDDQYASPVGWRKRWSSFDPEQEEFDGETARIADSYDRQARARGRSQGGMEPVGRILARLPAGDKRNG